MTISLTYSDSRADLPASRGVGYPHIIITDGFNSGSKNARRLHAADGIVTLLNKFDPKALDAFLNLEKPFFVYHGEEVKLGHLLDAVVFREGNLVTAEYLASEGHWDLCVEYSIDDHGRWIPSGSYAWLAGRSSSVEDVDQRGTNFALWLIAMARWRIGSDAVRTFSSEEKDFRAKKDAINPMERDELLSYALMAMSR